MQYFWKKKTIVSFVLALLVVSIHNSATEQYTLQIAGGGVWTDINIFVGNLGRETVASVAVPLFFMLSGATFFRDYKKGMYKQKLVPRIKSLIIPYLIWNTVWMCFDIFCSYSPISRYFISREKFLITLPNFVEGIFFYKANGPFWFMYNLIIFVLLTPLFDFFTSSKRRAYLFVAFSLFLPLYASNIFSFAKMNARSVVFYALGCLIGKYYFNDLKKHSNNRVRVISGCICTICVVLRMLILYDIIPLYVIANQLLLIIFCFAFWKTMDCVAERAQVRPFFYTSFIIFAVHYNVEFAIVKVIYLLGPKEMWMGIPNYIVSYCATVPLVCAFALTLKKFSPKIYAVVSGER